MANILVTGGAGFIGSNLIDQLLLDGHQVINIDNFCDENYAPIKEKNILGHLKYLSYKLYRIDILDEEKLNEVFKENKIEYIIHLAAKAGVRPSLENPKEYLKVNELGTLNILEMARLYNIKKIVLASSSSVYGNNKKVPFEETDNVDEAISPYASTKKANEVLAHVYDKIYNLDIILLRFFTVYGPRQRPDLAIAKFSKLILENKPITMFGDGSSSRDYTYIDDIVSGINASLTYLSTHRNVYEIINLGNSYPITLKDMIQTIEKNLSLKATIINKPMQEGDVDITYADISKANRLLGYKPKTSFENGIKKYILFLNK